jgi:DNA helicase-2/ATP-dependent DNA helicase PcrA
MKIQLNDSQQKAVGFKAGALLVVAGAGTGKTRIITERVKHLVAYKKTDPKNILALTFTDKAANEMLSRLDEVMPLGYEEPWVCTFHSFADRLLKLDGHEIGLDTNYKILTRPYEWLLFRKNLFNFDLSYFRPLGNPTKFIHDILDFISRLQDENIQPHELEEFAQNYHNNELSIDAQLVEKQKWTELAHVYKTFQQIKANESCLSFGDLIYYALKLFSERPNVLEKYKAQFEHVLVDEFQDTNFSQYLLIKLLFPSTEEKRSLVVVGDDSQSIYKFRGAAVANILGFMHDYPNAEMCTLTDNYRSGQPVLDHSYKVIKNNDPETLEAKLGINKKLLSKAVLPSQVNPRVISLETGEDEVEFVMKEILAQLASPEGYSYKDIAIIARANSTLDPFVFGLRKYGLPYQLHGNRGLYEREEVKNAIHLVRFIADPFKDDSVLRVLNLHVFDFSLEEIAGILSAAGRKREPVWDYLLASSSEKIQKFVSTIKKYQTQLLKQSPSEFIFLTLQDLNYTGIFLQEDSIENQLSIKNLDLFLTLVKRFEALFTAEKKEDPTIIDYLQELELLLTAGDNPAQAEIEDIDTINLMTAHSSKGLEFPVVFVVGLVAGRFPSANRRTNIDIPISLLKESVSEGDFHIMEERRLFYVAMTRAKCHLYLTFAKDYGGKRKRSPSGFIEETGLPVEEVSSKDLATQTKQISLFGVESGFKSPQIHKLAGLKVPEVLSFSQIDCYNTCGLQYKYRYVLSMPSMPSHVLSFGSTMHATLRDFHTHLMIGEEPDLNTLLTAYEKNWIPAGYIDKQHIKLRFEQGQEMLRRYYENTQGKTFKHFALEKSFRLYLGDTKFTGKIDRIDLVDGGVEIIDYKTGQPKDKYGDFDDQLNFYAFGAEVAFKLHPVRLTYYFLESGEKKSFDANPATYETTKVKVLETSAGIKKGDFTATPGMHCNWCDYRDICPYAYR